MIQELLGAAGFIGGDRKISINGSIFEATTSPSNTTTTTTQPPLPPTTTTTTNSNNTSSNSENNNQILRCPRCDSSNTKFCYYNNYNLTQPRHFCKTCRRYWTKGGALRNVPIGGGCRKNKNSTSTHVSAASFGKPSSSSSSTAANKMMKTVAYAGLGSGFEFDHHHHHHEFSSNPIMWNSSQNNSQLLAILRSSQNPNIINPAAGPLSSSVIGTHVIKGEPVGETMVLNPALIQQQQVPSQLGLCSPLWKNNHHQAQAQQYQQNGFLIGHEVHNSGVQELYQRLKSSTNNNYYDHSTSTGVLLSNGATSACSSSSATTILESAPVAGGELGGYWNPVFSWPPDLPTTNGSYP